MNSYVVSETLGPLPAIQCKLLGTVLASAKSAMRESTSWDFLRYFFGTVERL